MEATDPKEEAEVELHKEDEEKNAGDKVDMTLTGGKETNIDDAEVGATGGGKESALEPSGNESRIDVTAAAGQETSNKLDAKEEVHAQLPKIDEAKSTVGEVDMTLAGGKETNTDDAEVGATGGD